MQQMGQKELIKRLTISHISPLHTSANEHVVTPVPVYILNPANNYIHDLVITPSYSQTPGVR